MINIETPNLDAMDIDEILAFSKTVDSLDLPQTVKSRLKVYACLKAKAIESRLSGRIAKALEYEKTCDKIYGTLPEQYRW